MGFSGQKRTPYYLDNIVPKWPQCSKTRLQHNNFFFSFTKLVLLAPDVVNWDFPFRCLCSSGRTYLGIMALTLLFSRDFTYKIGNRSFSKTKKQKIKFFQLFCVKITGKLSLVPYSLEWLHYFHQISLIKQKGEDRNQN